jgi:Cdc6-like AAA superfamily ATPase
VALLDDAPRLLLALLAREEGKATTGHLWRAYRRAAPGAGLRPLTLRRISGLLRELEAADLVSAPVLSRGRKGRTKWAILTEEARRTLEEMETAAPPFGEDGPATEG